jgi:hypothetical protein
VAEEIVAERVLVTEVREAEILVAEVEVETEKDHLCTMRFVMNVATIVRFHFVRLVTSLSIVATVLKAVVGEKKEAVETKAEDHSEEIVRDLSAEIKKDKCSAQHVLDVGIDVKFLSVLQEKSQFIVVIVLRKINQVETLVCQIEAAKVVTMA